MIEMRAPMFELPLWLSLRPITPSDMDFLLRVYASTRAEEMALVDWPDAQKTAFLTMQFQAQHSHYQAHYHGAQFDIIERDGLPVGRWYVHRRANTLHVMDIALLPDCRRQGIGTALIGALMREAARSTGCITLYVEVFNTALKWYERLGFHPIDEEGVNLLMEWKAP
jgi:ribosomal protein S18 acetylase RimI-like enzyme